MKILILINTNFPINSLTYETCTNKYELIGYLMKNYLEAVCESGTEIIINKSYPHIHKKNADGLPEVDHIIFIDKTGFANKNINYFNYIKKFAKYSVNTICESNIYWRGEDACFYLYNGTAGQDNIIPLLYPIDDRIIMPVHLDNVINILIDMPTDEPQKEIFNDQILKYIEFRNEYPGIKFNIKLIDKDNNIYEFNQENKKETLLDTREYHKYIDFICETNVYIMLYKTLNFYRLFELATANAIIATQLDFIPKMIIDKVSAIIYDGTISWDIIIHKLENNVSRENLMNNEYNINTVTNIIHNRIMNYKNETSSTAVFAVSAHPIIKKVLKPTKIMDKIIPTEAPKKKQRIFIQKNFNQ